METENNFDEAKFNADFDAAWYCSDLRDKATYLELLLKRLDAFEQVDEKGDRALFSELMFVTLGSSGEWKRLREVASHLGSNSHLLKRYVLRGTSPAPRLQKMFINGVLEVVRKELKDILDEVEPLEAAAKARDDAKLKEWTDHADKVRNVLPDTWFNCQVQHQMKVKDVDGDGEYPVTIGISYPCRGVYSFGGRHAVACEHEDHDHGRVVIGGEGLALLPHIIRTQADVLRVLLDLEEHVFFNMYITDPVEHAEWIENGRQKFMSSPVIQALPEGLLEESESHDISRTVFVCI